MIGYGGVTGEKRQHPLIFLSNPKSLVAEDNSSCKIRKWVQTNRTVFFLIYLLLFCKNNLLHEQKFKTKVPVLRALFLDLQVLLKWSIVKVKFTSAVETVKIVYRDNVSHVVALGWLELLKDCVFLPLRSRVTRISIQTQRSFWST